MFHLLRKEMGSFCKEPVRYMARIHGSTQGQDKDIAGSGLAERLCALIHGGAGREDVVDQEDLFAGDNIGAKHGKRVTEVLESFFSWEGGLRRGGIRPGQIGAGHRNAEMTADPVGQQQRLIELPFTQAFDVEGNGDDQFDACKRWKPVDDKAGERLGQRDFPAILKQTNGVLERRQVGIEGPSPGIGGRMFTARSTEMIRTMGGCGG